MIRKVLPSKSVIYQSALHPKEVMQRLQDRIEAPRSFGFGSGQNRYSKPYIGKTWGNRFQISRVIEYRNSFLPQISGTVIAKGAGSQIEVDMKLAEGIQIFVILWLIGVSFAAIAIPTGMYFENAEATAGFAILIPIIMLIAGSTLVYFGFKTESKKSLVELEEILGARLVSPTPNTN